METRRRTILKSASYRVLGGLITMAIAWVATREMVAATTIGVLDTLVKLGVFYLHERLWLRIDYGRSHEPEYHI